MNEQYVVGRNPVLELLKSDRQIDKLYVLKGELQGSINKILGAAKDKNIVVQQVDRKKLDSMSEGNAHQGVVALVTGYEYSTIEEILEKAKSKDENPFIVILDGIEDVNNISNTIDELKDRGLWVYGADMDGENFHFNTSLTGAIALVIGNEGKGLSRLVKEKCDVLVKIPMLGNISSLNASTAASILIYEVVRQSYAKEK